ncbi:MAG TPA: hypothetical protein VGR21_00290, partial [Cryptosporangiaceae bacterium]|nr:hypothetical protein [Cryptosporangiaceae bacterium]
MPTRSPRSTPEPATAPGIGDWLPDPRTLTRVLRVCLLVLVAMLMVLHEPSTQALAWWLLLAAAAMPGLLV